MIFSVKCRSLFQSKGSKWQSTSMSTVSRAVKAVARNPQRRIPLPPRHGPRPSALPPAFRPVNPSLLVAKQGNGYSLFVPQIRKLIFEYCERSEQSERTRAFLLRHVEDVARANPHVEVVVKTRTLKPPIVRGLYRKWIIRLYVSSLMVVSQ